MLIDQLGRLQMRCRMATLMMRWRWKIFGLEIEVKQFSLVGREIVLCVHCARWSMYKMCIFPRYALNEN